MDLDPITSLWNRNTSSVLSGGQCHVGHSEVAAMRAAKLLTSTGVLSLEDFSEQKRVLTRQSCVLYKLSLLYGESHHGEKSPNVSVKNDECQKK